MHSLRTKITVMTVCAVIIAITVATSLSIAAIIKIGNSDSDHMLMLLCRTGERNLDTYFDSVEQSVEMVSAFIQSDLDGIDDLDEGSLAAHVDRSRDIFRKMAYQTNGVLTYYYRLDPAVTKESKGFWYVNLDGNDFIEHEPTDISLYDTEDTSQLVWFTVPKATGDSIWLPPYITDNLDKRVISYNRPIYKDDKFIGVAGIEIDYTTMADQVNSIKLYNNGYAFINDEKGKLIYHPLIDVTDGREISVPEGLLSDEQYVKYSFEGVKKRAIWLPLSNGMRLNVTVPVDEINRYWHNIITLIIVVSLILLYALIMFMMRFTEQITKPLTDLTAAAEQLDSGNYNVELNYNGDDEVGVLTRTFSNLIEHLKVYISDLNSLAYADSLTSVRNNRAFGIYMRELQEQIDSGEGDDEFAIAMFDCDDLKVINDIYGHDKGSLYIKSTSRLICEVFRHSPVFRLGGDEFAALLQGEDYSNRKRLMKKFERRCVETYTAGFEPWEQVHAAMGMAEYDPKTDEGVDSVVQRADALMYENKRMHKEQNQNRIFSQ